MVKVTSTFTAGKMNKVVDERLLPPGQYVDAQNLRLGSTETSEVGSIELTKGNSQITNITFNATAPSASARCIGAYPDNANEKIYWFIHDPAWNGNGAGSPVTTTILDMVVSYNLVNGNTYYHLISVQEGTAGRSTLNFSHNHLITGINLVDDLLFWTDNLNPPRSININQGFVPPTVVAGVVTSTDNFSAEEIRVIVKPPLNAPTVALSTGPDKFNFLKERFISFGYRYKYIDGEYSATSQFSAPAFVANQFLFSPSSFLNEGMTNKFNIANVTVNSGSSYVKGIELLWKDNDDGVIKVMERIDKEGQIADNVDVVRSFKTSKILTVLPDSEILRLYDNVPRFAKAQTLMGNRLVYGNYIENYDLKATDADDGIPTNICYEAVQINEEIGITNLNAAISLSASEYQQDWGPQLCTDTKLNIDLAAVAGELTAGSRLSIELEFDDPASLPAPTFHQSSQLLPQPATNPDVQAPLAGTPFEVSFDFVFPQTYTGVGDLATSTSFLSVVGVPPGSSMAFPQASSGSSWTDIFNTTVPQTAENGLIPVPFPPNTLYAVGSSITQPGSPIEVTWDGGTVLSLRFPATRYSQDPADALSSNIAVNVMHKISNINPTVTFAANATPPSLHSNRGYEVGIVYMDAFKRATTAFTSLTNAIHIGCSQSSTTNSINITIPPAQVAPWWAQSYKFVIKPSHTTYETIYANLVFKEVGASDAYILLQGENARKVEEGTRLIVKADLGGPINSCKYVTVLEKAAKEPNFITVPSDPANPNSPSIPIPAGVYIKIKATGFNLDIPPNAISTTGWQSVIEEDNGSYPVLKLGPSAFNEDLGGGNWGPALPLPAGSRVQMKFYFLREGPGQGEGPCEKREYTYEPDDFFVGGNYPSVIDWWNAEGIGDVIELTEGTQFVGDNDCAVTNDYDPIVAGSLGALNLSGNSSVCTNKWRWFNSQAPATNGLGEIRLLVRGTKSCGNCWPWKKCSKVEGEITIFRASNLLIFETMPSEALPDVWYEGSDNYGIQDGNHLSGTFSTDVDQDIATGTAASVRLSNFNCYTYGNGCESYTIRDSVKGDSFSLGNRVTSTASQDYGRIHRYADLTYSGVYNDESNINKLNEFNLGLLNFKPLEDSFGLVQKLVGRKSDILVLQEDKISYVLSGKNLLSDSTGGGAVTATPTVLGTQIARLEEYGISNNPESYAEYGYDKYFCDEKRGAVIKLTGGSHSSETLEVISEHGMRSWFRDLFIAETNDIKLGGYDPYMNEYVFNSSDIQLPQVVPCIDCGGTYNYSNDDTATPIEFCVNLGEDVGDVTITTGAVALIIQSTYNGVTTSSFLTNTHTFTKGSVSPTTAVISILSTETNIEFTPGCVIPTPLIIRTLVINSPQYGLPVSETVHCQSQWTDSGFTSNLNPSNASAPTALLSMPGLPTTVNCVDYAISQCTEQLGFQGQGQFPTDGATVTIQSSTVLATDTFTFNPTYHRLGYLRTTAAALWDCNDFQDIVNILAAATFPALNPQQVTGAAIIDSITFAMPAPFGVGTNELWLIYDYRVQTSINLCKVETLVSDFQLMNDVCCACSCQAGETTAYTLFTTSVQSPSGAYITFQYYNTLGALITQSLVPGQSDTVCVSGVVGTGSPIILPGYEPDVNITIDQCNCT
jgi:hypothetical protein